MIEIVKRLWDKMPSALKNKYILTSLLFVLWVLLFDPNSLIKRVRSFSNIQKLKFEKSYYEKQIEQSTRELNEIKNNKASIEQYARENYYMKNDNEEVFVIEEVESKKK